MEFTNEQIAHIRATVASGLEHPEVASTLAAGQRPDFGCAACMVGLNIVAAIPLAVIVAAGVAVAPEAAAVVAIAAFFDASAVTVAAVINAAIASGGITTVEEMIAALCRGLDPTC